jgi:hypothetical protein
VTWWWVNKVRWKLSLVYCLSLSHKYITTRDMFHRFLQCFTSVYGMSELNLEYFHYFFCVLNFAKKGLLKNTFTLTQLKPFLRHSLLSQLVSCFFINFPQGLPTIWNLSYSVKLFKSFTVLVQFLGYNEIQSHCQVVSTSALYSGCLWFIFEPRCRLSWLRFSLVIHSLHDVHEMNTQGWSCLFVCLHDSTREQLDRFGWNSVWTLCHGGLP